MRNIFHPYGRTKGFMVISSAHIFDALVECVQIIHRKLKMDRTVFGEGIFLTKKNQNAAGNPIFQTAICNSIIPTVKRVQAEN